MASKKTAKKSKEMRMALTIATVLIVAIAVVGLALNYEKNMVTSKMAKNAAVNGYKGIIKSACAGIAIIPGYIECNAAVLRAIEAANTPDIKYIATNQYGRNGSIYYIFKITGKNGKTTCIRVDAKTGNAEEIPCKS